MKIPFNKPFLTGKETHYIYQAVYSGKLSGNGTFTKKCHNFFNEKFGFKHCLLTTSCTDALEMSALLLDIQPSDEVIMPAYTFVSTANAFVLRGAKIVFADSCSDQPGIDPQDIESLINSKTKAIVVVHYAGVACDMDKIMNLAEKHGVYVVEDAAQSIDSYYDSKPLGSIGHLAAFSFHETKNIISGEGGMLVINEPNFVKRAEIVWEKGTNRSSFFRGEVDKYGWIDIGSSFLPSEVIAAFLFAQLENLESIQSRRKEIWKNYAHGLNDLGQSGKVQMPFIPDYATNNAHMFYLVCRSLNERNELIKFLAQSDIRCVFHYLSLHKSPYFKNKHDGRDLMNSDRYTDCLVRLPFFHDLKPDQQVLIIEKIMEFFS